jgi:hypothetical protein
MLNRCFSLISLFAAAVCVSSLYAQTATPCLVVSPVQMQNDRYVYLVRLDSTLDADQVIVVTPFAASGVMLTPDSQRLTAETALRGRLFSFTLRTPSTDAQAVLDAIVHVGSDPESADAAPIRECGDTSALPTATMMPTRTRTVSASTPRATPTISTAGAAFSPRRISLVEGGEEVLITIRSLTAPRRTEALTVLPLYDPAQLSVSPSTREISFTNWNPGVVFAVSARQDDRDEGDHTVELAFYLTSSDPLSAYFNLTLPDRLIVNIQDVE